MRQKYKVIWKTITGEKVACVEKIKVMMQNIEELEQMAQDAYEDAILMGINPAQIKEFLIQLMHNLHNPYEG